MAILKNTFIRIAVLGFVLLTSTFLWMAYPINMGFDATIQKWIAITKTTINLDKHPAQNEFVYIDVSRSKFLLPIKGIDSEKKVITNRKYLIKLFNYIVQNGNQVKYVLCDVNFSDTTGDDLELKKAANSLGDKFLTVNTTDDINSKNSLRLRAATASVILHNGAIYKMPLYSISDDDLVPLKMYQDIEKCNTKNFKLFTYFQKKGISFNTQIDNLYIRAENNILMNGYDDLELGSLVSSIDDLNSIAPSKIFNQFLKNRYIIIGDLEGGSDMHQTYLNSQPGSLILFNAFWQLKINSEILPFYYILLLYLFLCFVLWLRIVKKSYTVNLKILKKIKINVNVFSITLLLSLFTILSSVVLHINVSIFYLVIIFSLIDFFYKLKKHVII